jgi:cellobiose phosphorylase
MAECIVGRGDLAYEYYKKLSPMTKNKMAEIHMAEPYIYSQTIASRVHPKFGEAKNSWLTGTAAWMMKASADWILGIRPQHQGLLVDPCIPKKWDGFKVARHFRNAVYDIGVKNPNHVSKGVKTVTVDGKSLKANLLPVFADRKKHTVKVTMG